VAVACVFSMMLMVFNDPALDFLTVFSETNFDEISRELAEDDI
jgi:hypothetical protein